MKNNIAVIIYQNVVNAMQDAEEMGGPEGDEYIELMDKIILEAQTRKTTYKTNSSSNPNNW